MRLLGLMLVRSEAWIIETSLKAALKWCDAVVLMDHASIDGTLEIVEKVSSQYQKGTVCIYHWPDASRWDEMICRQRTLEMGRSIGGTHFAMIDADEILTANYLDSIRSEVESLTPGQVLDLPMVAMRSLDGYQNDGSMWSTAWLSVAFADKPTLTWKPREDGYQHHNRCPFGVTGNKRVGSHGGGGAMHLQFVNKRRLLSKHILYRMVDHLRWPGRDSVTRLNEKYDWALQEPKELTEVPKAWWGDYEKDRIMLDGIPWQDAEIERLIAEHGREAFTGLDLKGR